MEESYLTFMRNCVLGGNTFGAFRGDRIQEGTLFNFSTSMILLIFIFQKNTNTEVLNNVQFATRNSDLKEHWPNTLMMSMKEQNHLSVNFVNMDVLQVLI
jgi:hypothetical protein